LEVINGYGPTENTTFSTTYRIERDFSDNIPIGRPIANSTAYILDPNDNLQPVGAVGELVVGGDGVSRGYLNQPELTIKSFCGVQGQFFQKAPLAVGDDFYYTGDLARWLSDGSIEFLGRRDQQVKIRGYRIEPGEIEAHILNLDEIKEVVVVVREGENGEKYLCAYCVASGIGGFDVPGLRLKLSETLPDYMIPLYFISMERLPLTHNKKIDIRALPEPQWSAGANYVPPTNEMEKKLAGIWSEVLGLDREVIGIDDDFFELGGHSLKATILLSRMHKELKIKIPLVEIFSAPTIRELGRYIRGKKEDIYTAISPAPGRDHYVLSSAQKRLYLLQQMDPGSTLYNIPLVYTLEGRFDKQRMASTFKKMIQRHESLRTSFHTIDHQPVQKVHDEVEFEIEYLAAADHFIRPFDLSCAPLLRVVVVPLAEEKHMLMVDMHHIITDGTSMGIFVRDFKALYIGDTLPGLAVQYKDYSEWSGNGRARELLEQQETYWLKEFAGELPVLHLPLDFPRPAKQSFEGGSVSFEIGAEQTGRLKALVSEEDETLFILLFSAFTVLLHKLTGQEDIIVGTAAANRGHPDLHHTIGMFVNTLALRNYPTGEKTFSQFLKEVKERSLEAFENQDYPFENLFEKITINRDMSRNPIYDTAFGLQNMEIPPLEFPGLTFVPYHHKNKVSKFDMAWSAAEEGDKLMLQVEYTSKLFKEQTIKKFTSYFKEILAAVVENKNIRLKDIRISHDQFDRKLNYPQVEFGF
jgi:surfactin family lipopeptide synthetase B/lichenysin synthetase B